MNPSLRNLMVECNQLMFPTLTCREMVASQVTSVRATARKRPKWILCLRHRNSLVIPGI